MLIILYLCPKVARIFYFKMTETSATDKIKLNSAGDGEIPLNGYARCGRNDSGLSISFEDSTPDGKITWI
jgi:hypothetical protein